MSLGLGLAAGQPNRLNTDVHATSCALAVTPALVADARCQDMLITDAWVVWTDTIHCISAHQMATCSTNVKEVCGAAASNTMHSSCDHIAEQGIHARISMWVAQRHHPTTPVHLGVAHFELSLRNTTSCTSTSVKHVFGSDALLTSIFGTSAFSHPCAILRRPSRTRVFDNNADFRKDGIDASGKTGADWITCPEHFKQSGWTTLGGGKTFHPGHPANFDEPTSWSQDMPYFPFSYYIQPNKSYPSGQPCPLNPHKDPSNACASAIDTFCPVDEVDDHFYDFTLANNTVNRLRYVAQRPGPWFVQSGFARPHAPWRVPRRFWDMYVAVHLLAQVCTEPAENMHLQKKSTLTTLTRALCTILICTMIFTNNVKRSSRTT